MAGLFLISVILWTFLLLMVVKALFVPTSKCEHSGIPAIFRRDTKKLRLEIKERLAKGMAPLCQKEGKS